MSAARFETHADAIDNALLCYGVEAREGIDFQIGQDRHGWGWAALRPVPLKGNRERSLDNHRALYGRQGIIRKRERGLHRVAIDA